MKRPLLLNGYTSSGTSEVGRRIAAGTGHPFVDLAEQSPNSTVEQNSGGRPKDPSGREQLRATIDAWRRGEMPSPIVALGADTLLPRAERLAALDECVVVLLDSLLDVDANTELGQTLALRAYAYAECHGRVSVSGVNPSEVASLAESVWRRDPLAVATGERSYCVDVGPGICSRELAHAVGRASRVVLVTDEHVEPLHAGPVRKTLAEAGFECTTVVLRSGEQHKTIEGVSDIWKHALEAGADRSSVFVALGGGIVTDMAGFAAATWMRGVRWISIPTTLLGMVDASVGGKTGVDLASAKNAVGSFWQPSAVLCDVAHLRTEPDRGFTGALAEVVKTALIGDPDLLRLLEQRPDDVRSRDPNVVAEMVRRCVRVKARVVSADERESGLRAVLNLGHTVGHALESGAGYVGLTHGEAVSLGLIAAVQIGSARGWTPPEVAARTGTLLGELGLPVALDQAALAKAAALIVHDKKRRGTTLRFVVVRDVGRVEPTTVNLDDLIRWTGELNP